MGGAAFSSISIQRLLSYIAAQQTCRERDLIQIGICDYATEIFVIYRQDDVFSPTELHQISRTHPTREEGGSYSTLGSTGTIPPYFHFAPIPTAESHTPPFLYGLGRARVVQELGFVFLHPLVYESKPNLTTSTEVCGAPRAFTWAHVLQSGTCVSGYGFRGVTNVKFCTVRWDNTKC